jgi:hypothetical protein
MRVHRAAQVGQAGVVGRGKKVSQNQADNSSNQGCMVPNDRHMMDCRK